MHRNVEKETKLTPYRLISGNRTALMGFCILWIVFYHSSVEVSFLPLRIFKGTAYLALDMFIFVSGMGTFNSLRSHPAPEFFHRRLKKLIPIWWSYLLVRIVLEYVRFGRIHSFLEILGFASFTGFWAQLPMQGNWYVYGIMFFYLIAPAIYGVITESRNRARTALVLVLGAVVISLPFLGHFMLQVFARLPQFIMGMLFSAYMKEKTADRKMRILCAGSFLAGLVLIVLAERSSLPFHYKLVHGFFWYPCTLASAPLAWYLSKGLERMRHSRIRFLHTGLEKTGLAALEILFATDYIFGGTYDWTDGGLRSWAILLIGIAIGFVYYYVIEKARKLWPKKA